MSVRQALRREDAELAAVDVRHQPHALRRIAVRGMPAVKVRQVLGALLLLGVIVVVLAVTVLDDDAPAVILVKGYGGDLKVSFLSDPAVAEILAERYGLRVVVTRRGSIEMTCATPLGPEDDFVWLGDSVALAKYRQCGGAMLRADNVYNSPIVLYSWTPVVDALAGAGVARAEAGGTYSVDFARLVELIQQGRTWADLGLPQLHGKIVVHSSDPGASNSGFLFAGLLANTLNGGDVVDATTVGPLLPGIRAYFGRLGYMEQTSGDLFEQFRITGMGAKPIVALYESQVPEFLGQDPSSRDWIGQQVRILYPRPTVWATHPFVARTEDGARLLDALKDPEIQRLAWERHGQRTGVVGVPNDPDVLPIPGVAAQIPAVIGMPGPDAMDRILAAIVAPPDGTKGSATPSLPAATPMASPGR
jgi:hypothetical protein